MLLRNLTRRKMPKEELKCGQYDKAIDAYHKCGDCDLCTVKEVEKKVEWQEEVGNILIALREDRSKEVVPEILHHIIQGAINKAIKAERARVLEEKKKIMILGTSRRAGEATSLRYLKQYSDEIDKIINPKE